MRIATITAAAIALVATIGTVSAADQLATLKGVNAVQMSSGELGTVKGMDNHFFVNGVRHDTDQFQDANGKGNFKELTRPGTGDVRLASPGYQGLILHACLVSGGVITGPSAAWC